MRITMAQLRTRVGDVSGNAALVAKAMEAAEEAGADLCLTPELALPGYPPEDLLRRSEFILAQQQALEALAARSGEVWSVVGHARAVQAGRHGDARPRGLQNAASVLHRGEVAASVVKVLLPNHGVFDEARYFLPAPGPTQPVEITLRDGSPLRVGVAICEDVWAPEVPEALVNAGAELLVVVNASPYHEGKPRERAALVSETARRLGVGVAYLNCTGGQDEVVFDGGSIVTDATGQIVWRGQFCAAEIQTVELALEGPSNVEPGALWPEGDAEVYAALVQGLRDYSLGNGFERAILGLSGGVDSALVCALAVDALGPERVLAVGMPGPYSSAGSVRDARAGAERLGVRFEVIPIQGVHEEFRAALGELVEDAPHAGLANENLQARERGMMLMAISNAAGGIVLATGNKSEVSVGYSTLYGDAAGGFSPLKDVLKTRVYALARWRNAAGQAVLDHLGLRGRTGEVVPEEVLTKAPSAELAPDQTDERTLGSYEDLDAVLALYVEGEIDPRQIADATGLDADYVTRITSMVDRNEYKRRQGAPGVKVTRRSFGRDRRLPITNAWTGSAALAASLERAGGLEPRSLPQQAGAAAGVAAGLVETARSLASETETAAVDAVAAEASLERAELQISLARRRGEASQTRE